MPPTAVLPVVGQEEVVGVGEGRVFREEIELPGMDWLEDYPVTEFARVHAGEDLEWAEDPKGLFQRRSPKCPRLVPVESREFLGSSDPVWRRGSCELIGERCCFQEGISFWPEEPDEDRLQDVRNLEGRRHIR